MSDRAEKLLQVRYNVSQKPHILVDTDKCAVCTNKICLLACPAGCFTEEEGGLKFQYEGCLECGTCRAVCQGQDIWWAYPQGGFGVSFRVG